MVHGVFDTNAAFSKLAPYLERRGYSTFAPTLSPRPGNLGLDDLAGKLRDYIDQQLGADARFDLIGFSMGGLVSRYYIQRLGGASRINRLVTISAPHHGSRMAYLSGTKAAKQMRPDSEFIRDLNSDVDVLEQMNVLSLWTPLDLMIVPPRSSRLAIATERLFPVVAHPLMLRDRRCLKEIGDFLDAV